MFGIKMGQSVRQAGDAEQEVRLARGDVLVLSLGARRGQPCLQVVSRDSVLWVTQDGDPNDRVLYPGERMTLCSSSGRAVLQGMR